MTSTRKLVLEAGQGVRETSDGFVADALPAWLRIPNFFEVCGHNWFSIRYACGFFDRPIRPLIRFTTRMGREYTYILDGPVMGTAEWTGRVPDNAITASISPTGRLGPFAFRIEHAKAISKYSLLSKNLGNGVTRSKRLIGNRLSDPRQFEIDLYKIANAATPILQYRRWKQRHRRVIDIQGFDRPRSDWAKGPIFALIACLDSASEAEISRTVRSLQKQIYHNWLFVPFARGPLSEKVGRIYRNLRGNDQRLREISASCLSFVDIRADWFATTAPGDELEDFALGAMAEDIADDPKAKLVYSDEEIVDVLRRQIVPLLKPDWSPKFHAASGYVGRLAVFRRDVLLATGIADPCDISTHERQTLGKGFDTLSGQEVSHVQRILYRRQDKLPRNGDQAPANAAQHTKTWPDATIIIATKDRADLLRNCVHGLRELTDDPTFNVVIVDNGTTQKSALTILESLEDDSRFTVLKQPVPFNFSALSNEGARRSLSRVLVFMNNDIEMQDRNWLRPLIDLATQPDVGVVGAKLLFPTGRIQHAGVTLGLGGVAGHLYSNKAIQGAAYLQHLDATREVSAVTAACCAIERSKFESLGGFDEVNFPVEFSDIDLCLRAMARGWSNVVAAKAVLIHHESETRGVARSKTYETERKIFLERWMHIVRDDPYFHPGLSLFSLMPALN